MTPAQMAQLHQQCFTTPRPWSKMEISDLLDQRGVFVVTCPAGFALGRVVVDEAELLTLAVDPDRRRAGWGARLLTEFELAASTRAAVDAFLEVAADNRAALALYASYAYAAVGRRRGYYRPASGRPVDALVLKKSLVLPQSPPNRSR